MTKIKWRLLLSSLVILATVAYGWTQYAALPATMATHWGLNNEVNGWLPKPVLVFGLPALMLLLQWVLVSLTWYAGRNSQPAPRLERVTAWILPVVTVVVYVLTIRRNLGANVDIRFWVVLLVAGIFLVLGNYLPTAPAEQTGRFGWGYHWPGSTPGANSASKRAIRQVAYLMVLGGIALLISLLCPPLVSVSVLIAVIAGLLLLGVIAMVKGR